MWLYVYLNILSVSVFKYCRIPFWLWHNWFRERGSAKVFLRRCLNPIVWLWLIWTSWWLFQVNSSLFVVFFLHKIKIKELLCFSTVDGNWFTVVFYLDYIGYLMFYNLPCGHFWFLLWTALVFCMCILNPTSIVIRPSPEVLGYLVVRPSVCLYG